MGYALGVDLGTTYTAAAVARGQHVEVVPLGDRAAQVPSVIFRPPTGPLMFGEAAARHAVSEPSRVAREFKRRIGDQTDIYLGGTPMSAPALSHALLEWVVQRVTEGQGEPPTSVTVTHPANWGPFRRELMDQVVSLDAGITTLVCTEPEAAAVHFAASGRLAPGQPIAVYDLGGGTFDAAILRRGEGAGFELVGAPEGLEQLGGIDFDEAVFRHVLGAAGVGDLDPDDDEVTDGLARLRHDCVDAKEALTNEVSVSVPVALGARRTSVRLNRHEFEELIRPLIAQTVAALHRAIRRAGLSPDQLGAVLLVGGSSRVPLVAELVTEALRRPVVVTSQPKLAVAMGAALLGAAELAAAAPQAETGIATSLSSPVTVHRVASPVASPLPGPASAGSPAPRAFPIVPAAAAPAPVGSPGVSEAFVATPAAPPAASAFSPGVASPPTVATVLPAAQSAPTADLAPSLPRAQVPAAFGQQPVAPPLTAQPAAAEPPAQQSAAQPPGQPPGGQASGPTLSADRGSSGRATSRRPRRRPRRSVVWHLVSLAIAVAAILLAIFGTRVDTSPQLTWAQEGQVATVKGTTWRSTDRLRLTFLGLPLSDPIPPVKGGGGFNLHPYRVFLGGSLRADLNTRSGKQPALVVPEDHTTLQRIASIQGVVMILAALFSFAYAESLLRGIRQGRRRVAAGEVMGLVGSGVVAALALVTAAWVLDGQFLETSWAIVTAAAAVAAVGLLAFGWEDEPELR